MCFSSTAPSTGSMASPTQTSPSVHCGSAQDSRDRGHAGGRECKGGMGMQGCDQEARGGTGVGNAPEARRPPHLELQCRLGHPVAQVGVAAADCKRLAVVAALAQREAYGQACLLSAERLWGQAAAQHLVAGLALLPLIQHVPQHVFGQVPGLGGRRGVVVGPWGRSEGRSPRGKGMTLGLWRARGRWRLRRTTACAGPAPSSGSWWWRCMDRRVPRLSVAPPAVDQQSSGVPPWSTIAARHRPVIAQASAPRRAP